LKQQKLGFFDLLLGITRPSKQPTGIIKELGYRLYVRNIISETDDYQRTGYQHTLSEDKQNTTAGNGIQTEGVKQRRTDKLPPVQGSNSFLHSWR
jgi:hypothetical protein